MTSLFFAMYSKFQTFCSWSRYLHRHHYTSNVLPPLVFFTDRNKIPDVYRVIQQLPRGSMVIIRDYDHPNRHSYALSITRLARKRGHVVLVAGSARLALSVKADGLHIPERCLVTQRLWRNINPKWILTTSAHRLPTLIKIRHYPISAVFYSPVFQTTSHPEVKELGHLRFISDIKHSKCPIYALGGVSSENIAILKHSKAMGVAGIDVFKGL